jgi:uncharacterized protein YcfL
MLSKRSRLSFRALLATAALVSSAACTTAPQGAVNSVSGSENPRAKQKVEGNQMLAVNLETKNIITSRRNDLLLVQFDLVNRNSGSLGFQWTVDWFDRQGIKVPDATRHWEPMRLAGYATQTVTIVAPNAAAESWRLQVGARDEVQ